MKKATHINQFSTGDWIGVEGTTTLARGIQKFQKISDKKSGHLNHSMRFWWLNNRPKVVEATFVRKLRAAVNFSSFEYYLESDAKLYLFKLKEPLTEAEKIQFDDLFEEAEARKYPRITLFREHIMRVLTGIWTWNKSDKDFVCHELSQWFMFKLRGWFPKWYRGDVADEYHSNYYEAYEVDKEAVLKSIVEPA